MGKSRKRGWPFFIAAAIAAIVLVLWMAVAYMAEPPKLSGAILEGPAFEQYENALFAYEINRYSSKAEVSNETDGNISVGVSTDPRYLDFGIIPTGGSFSKRSITLSNTKDDAVTMQLRAHGGIVPFIEFGKNDFMLEKGSVPVSVIFRTAKDTQTGNYSGEIDIIARRPKYAILRGLE